ncbi:conserved Plasmodium protein, unknown function [Plasmodium relictum]|uniref:Uncharacterized protein n=1 Tax=Plasmodium relictum TaxID=85471 RepID=A0A1J1H498_PLARL|nr:conserved Plasmodium protein, unknown function [Plasmodium relictum]CRG99732.1 conserved Plasmodium protein, unknown function [Plasmodium relictum]
MRENTKSNIKYYKKKNKIISKFQEILISMSNKLYVKKKPMMKKEDELNLIKDYLNDLNSCTQKLYNTNYYNTLSKYKELNDKKEYSISNCLRTKRNDEDQFKSIDFNDYSTELDSENSFSECLEEQKAEERKEKKKKKKKVKDLNEKNKKKDIIFSFNKQTCDKNITKDSRYNNCGILKIENKNRLFDNLRDSSNKGKCINEEEISYNINDCSTSFYDNKKKKETLSLCKELSNKTTCENELNTCKKKIKKNKIKNSDYNSIKINNGYCDDEIIKKFDVNESSEANKDIDSEVFYNKDEKKNIKCKLDKSYKFSNIKHLKNFKIKDLKEKEQNIIFSNEREKELFQYLILKAINEIESISCKLEHKYKNELTCRVNKIRNEYEQKIKELLKKKAYLCVESERMIEKDKDNKELIRKLENTKNILLDQIETLRRKNELMYDKCFQKELFKNKNELEIKKLTDQIDLGKKQIEDYEKRINMLNEDLNKSYENFFYYQNKWNDCERTLHQKEDEIIKLKNQLEKCLIEKNEVDEKLKYTQNQNMKIEEDNDYLMNELNKTKLLVVKLKEEIEEITQNKEYMASCYKNEEKKLKEDLENYKTKCALLENKKGSQLLEEKYKKIENRLKDIENEKSIYERTCLKNEKIQKDLEMEIKNLKNELYECKNKLHIMNKSTNYNFQIPIYNSNINDEVLKENIEVKENNELQKNDTEIYKNETFEKPSDIKHKINSLEKQLILIRLEKTNRESELIRCPKYGRKAEEIKRKEFLETRLKYLDDKINMLNKNLKYIRMKNSTNAF